MGRIDVQIAKGLSGDLLSRALLNKCVAEADRLDRHWWKFTYTKPGAFWLATEKRHSFLFRASTLPFRLLRPLADRFAAGGYEGARRSQAQADYFRDSRSFRGPSGAAVGQYQVGRVIEENSDYQGSAYPAGEEGVDAQDWWSARGFSEDEDHLFVTTAGTGLHTTVSIRATGNQAVDLAARLEQWLKEASDSELARAGAEQTPGASPPGAR
ncbi:MAG: hypothetical protein HY261_08180 [Chloroflexi bacterium]|nr:hypothetical protein [Chloroflexota bacterium]